jgi:hypothetical protein
MMKLPETAYNRVTTYSILGAVASVLLYDRVPGLHWVSLGIGAISGLVAMSCYLHSRFSDKPTTIGQELDAAARPIPLERSEESDVPEARDVVRRIAVSWAAEQDHRRLAKSLELEYEHLRHSPPHSVYFWGSRSLSPLGADNLLLDANVVKSDPRAMVGAVVQIANRLASENVEVVLSPEGQIVVRPCSTTLRAASDDQLAFPDLILDEAGTRGRPN